MADTSSKATAAASTSIPNPSSHTYPESSVPLSYQPHLSFPGAGMITTATVPPQQPTQQQHHMQHAAQPPQQHIHHHQLHQLHQTHHIPQVQAPQPAAPAQQPAPAAHHAPANAGILGPPPSLNPNVPPSSNLWAINQQQMYAAAFAAMGAATAVAGVAAEAATSQAPTAPRPTFVNAKQYRRILKRREARAKLEEYYRKRRAFLKNAKDRKPYMHESRHRHAMKRPRGPGGRFLTKAELEVYYKERPEEDPSRLGDEPNRSAATSPSENGSEQGFKKPKMDG